MRAGRWGELRSVVGLYNKGILNNGSHMLDLLSWLVGSMEIVRVGSPIQDHLPEDPTVPVWLEGPNGVQIHLACAHAKDYALFELQLILSGGILVMEEGGMFWRERPALDSDTFHGYRLPKEGVRRGGGYPKAMLQAVDNIYRAVTKGDVLASTGESALHAQRLCEQIRIEAMALR
jgi:predicted dehydrogenase